MRDRHTDEVGDHFYVYTDHGTTIFIEGADLNANRVADLELSPALARAVAASLIAAADEIEETA